MRGCHMFIMYIKEELAYTTDKWLWVTTIMLFKNSYSTKGQKGTKAVLNLKQYCMHCYVALCNIFQLFRDNFYLSSLAK